MWTVVQFQMYFPQSARKNQRPYIFRPTCCSFANFHQIFMPNMTKTRRTACVKYLHQLSSWTWLKTKTNRQNFNQHTLTRNFCLSENDLRENIKSIFPPICRLGAGSQASMAPNKSCMMDHLQTIESNLYILIRPRCSRRTMTHQGPRSNLQTGRRRCSNPIRGRSPRCRTS